MLWVGCGRVQLVVENSWKLLLLLAVETSWSLLLLLLVVENSWSLLLLLVVEDSCEVDILRLGGLVIAALKQKNTQYNFTITSAFCYGAANC